MKSLFVRYSTMSTTDTSKPKLELVDKSSELKGQKEVEGLTHKQEKQCEKCRQYRDWMLKYSPNVLFMVQEIERLGGKVPLDKINCEICKKPKYGGYHPELGIQLCANYIPSKSVLNDTLSHELVHWYDNMRFQVDWLNLRHHACSEVRAASLSGECAIMTEFWKHAGFMKMAKGHQRCVRRKAILSVMGHPACKSKEQAEQVVDEVFRSCFNDTRPYERIYR